MTTLPEYIKPGSFVKLRDGSKGEIYSTDNSKPYPIHGRILPKKLAATWTNHLYVDVTMIPSEQDIIGPWIDAPDCSALWPLLPPWIKYLAMDDDSIWNGYSHKPKIGISVYHCTESGHNYCSIPKEYSPIYSGDWKDSLVERPS